MNNYSQFSFDGFGRNTKIVETTSGSVTKQFLFHFASRCEERNSGGAFTKGFYKLGLLSGSTSYFYARDHLKSIQELTDSAGGVQSAYHYESYGRSTKLHGSVDSDVQYGGYYFHARSKTSLTLTRQYSAALGRWLSRDLLEEDGGSNLYSYVNSNPVSSIDPLGLLDTGGGTGVSTNAFQGSLSI